MAYEVLVRRYSSTCDPEFASKVKAFVVGIQSVSHGERVTQVFAEFPVTAGRQGPDVLSERMAEKFAFAVCESLNKTMQKIEDIEVTI